MKREQAAREEKSMQLEIQLVRYIVRLLVGRELPRRTSPWNDFVLELTVAGLVMNKYIYNFFN